MEEEEPSNTLEIIHLIATIGSTIASILLVLMMFAFYFRCYKNQATISKMYLDGIDKAAKRKIRRMIK